MEQLLDNTAAEPAGHDPGTADAAPHEVAAEPNCWLALLVWLGGEACGAWLALLRWLHDPWLDIVRATRSWIQYGTVGFAVLCILIGAVEALFGR